MPLPRVLIAEPDGFSARALEALKASAEVTLEAVPVGQLAARLPEFDAVWVRLAHRLGATDVERAGRCRVIACPATGLDHLDVEACTRAGIRVVSLRGETDFLRDVRATAELAVALALAVMRRLPAAAASALRGAWERERFRGRELQGKTVGIVGVGRLGTLVARYLQAFDMKVLGHDVRPFSVPGVEPMATLEALLAASDLVTLHVSYDASTHQLFGRRAFAAMKRGAYLVNTSRGGIVDEAALLEALSSGAVAGAALDVVSGEPHVTAAHPLVQYARAHDHLVLSPHIGGNTFESAEKTDLFIAGKLLEVLRA